MSPITLWKKTMPTTQEDRQGPVQKRNEREQLKAIIGKHVIHALGRPSDLHRVQVRPLWGDHFRVNVFVGVDAASAKVAHSYFLVADSDGNVSAATPKITREYQKDQAFGVEPTALA
jgi:hypothetical protein